MDARKCADGVGARERGEMNREKVTTGEHAWMGGRVWTVWVQGKGWK